MKVSSAAALLILATVLVALASACGGGKDKGIAVSWQTEDGAPLQVSVRDLGSVHDTLIMVENDSGRTIEDAVIRFTPTTSQNAPAGFSVGTASNVHTDFDGDTHLWRLGDIEPNTRMVLRIGLWFATAQQISSAAPVDLIAELESTNQPSLIISNALTVLFQ
jgi:hypothetical protein